MKSMDITRYHGTTDTQQSMHYHPTLTISMVFHHALTQNHIRVSLKSCSFNN